MPKGPLTRVIYIKNPTDGGSHFRTVSGKYAPRKGKAPKSKRPKHLGPRTVTLTGGARYKTAASNWFIYTPPPSTLNYGVLPNEGTEPYSTQFLETPQGFGGTRPLRTWELILGGTIASIIGFTIPAGAFGTSGMGIAANATIQPALRYGGAAFAGAGGYGAITGGLGAETSFHTFDAPRVYWDKETGGYITEYTDLVHRIFGENDYRITSGSWTRRDATRQQAPFK